VTASDGHPIGVQNHEHFLFEHNRFERCGSAMDFHLGAVATQRSIVVRGNRIHDMRAAWSSCCGGVGVVFEGDHDAPVGSTSDIHVHNNVITSCEGVGISSSRKDVVHVYDNTVSGCMDNYRFTGNRADGASARMFNNVSLHPTRHHVWFNQNAGGIRFSFEAGHNLFFPDETGLFRFLVGGVGVPSGSTDLAGYLANHALAIEAGANTASDPVGEGSLAEDPLLDDAFAPLLGSPVIDSGAEVGLDVDFHGRPFTGTPDIGAIEHHAGAE